MTIFLNLFIVGLFEIVHNNPINTPVLRFTTLKIQFESYSQLIHTNINLKIAAIHYSKDIMDKHLYIVAISACLHFY
jgi:hypothetical protein